MRVVELLRKTGESFLTLLYPPHCAMCSADVENGKHLCDTCRNAARRIRAPFCDTCSQPFDGEISGSFSCANCAQRHFYFECAVTCYKSQGVVRELVHRFKYGREFHLRHPLSEWLIEGLGDARIAGRKFDHIVPVPLHPTRERERQFNQARVLAELLGKEAGLSTLDCLKRIRKTTTQTRFDRAERMENLRNAFQLRRKADVRGKHFLLVDDVFTTGSTVNECARVLGKGGAAAVCVLTVARG